MQEDLTQNAISLALKRNWKEAIKANLLILKTDKTDIDALNRLAHAYFVNGEIQKAKAKSQEVIKIDPNNSIALKSLTKKQANLSNTDAFVFTTSVANLFIEEPRKTKLTTLINLGSEKVCSCLNTGDEVLLTPYAHKISVTTLSGNYIGKLTDDLAARLRIHIKNGNKYKVLVKSARNNHVTVFIKGEIVSFARDPLEPLGEFSS